MLRKELFLSGKLLPVKLLFTFAFSLLTLFCTAFDSTKVYQTHRVQNPPRIDGIENDDAWKDCPSFSDFIMNRPIENGQPTDRTEVKIVYDNVALYVFAYLYSNPDSILRELGDRDDDALNADQFRFLVDPYNIRKDAYYFEVHASGVQKDYKFSDNTYDAVWESAVQINKDGWTVEMKIPYSAIRFPSTTVQDWAMQVSRFIPAKKERDQWSLVPSTAANPIEHIGTMKGIENIQAPVRLSLTPYLSTYVERSPEYTSQTDYTYGNTFSYRAGADLKYGIDDRFTLDLTLLPDFGQVQSDNKVKNLGYEEVIYDDKRTFFQEGVDLFSRNGLFYSRRIGKTPSLFYSVPSLLEEGEKIESNPSQAKLLNAFKISGRTDKGLGIGLFNAVTDNTYAEITTADGGQRKILTEPITNYNIVVFDQQLSDFSNVYFINTSAIRGKEGNDANNSGAGFTFADKKKKYATDGVFVLSQRFNAIDGQKNVYTNTLGYKYFVGVRKISGKFQWGISKQLNSKTYSQTDLGYFIRTNQDYYNASLSYNEFNPGKLFRDYNINVSTNYARNPETNKRTYFESNFNFYATLLSYNYFFIGGGLNPLKCYDYYEPRIQGRYNLSVPLYYSYIGIGTDQRKKISTEFNFNLSNFIGRFVGEGYNISNALKYRVNDRFSVKLINGYNFDPYNFGVADYSNPDEIIYGLRILSTYENQLAVKYIFKNDLSLTVSARHYWVTGFYRKYLTLLENGETVDNSTYNYNNNFNVNIFNVDAAFNWQFAPGSNMSIVYKNAIETYSPYITKNYGQDFSTTLDSPQLNSLSVRILYYLDYNSVFHKKKV